jgi:hypothetical protein
MQVNVAFHVQAPETSELVAIMINPGCNSQQAQSIRASYRSGTSPPLPLPVPTTVPVPGSEQKGHSGTNDPLLIQPKQQQHLFCFDGTMTFLK